MARTALIVIDVQESFKVRANWQLVNHADIAERVNRLVHAARDQGDLVVWVLHTEPGAGGPFDPAEGHVRLMDGLEPLPGEPMITKTAHNAFTTTNLQQLLTQHGVGKIVVSGIRTEQCCETTARVGSDLGYEVVFVTEATATMALAHWSVSDEATVEEILADPRTLTAEQVAERTEYVLAGRFATIRTIDELIGVPVAS
ncbi:isochorismatase family protein [Kribbella sp. NPDC051586]|uniref:isochorismatase family protein n=1 Tax=Kribbella sp. NPDC051586 TaxID=3364118 RepID=UPI00378826E5